MSGGQYIKAVVDATSAARTNSVFMAMCDSGNTTTARCEATYNDLGLVDDERYTAN